MPDNKRQHYVPQNYLRSFSPDGDSIGVFLIDSCKYIDRAPINSQAQEPYFYGKGLVLEKQLSELEGLLADNRRTIFENKTNKLNLYQKEVLYQDMMLQLSRTKQMADFYEEIATAYARRYWRHSSNEMVRQHADDFGIKFDNPVIAPMMVTLKNLSICLDLDFKILVNKTEIPFVTSDSPVCRYNQFFEAHRWFYSGLNSTGEQLFYPLSPFYAVIYYDHNVYKTKYRKRNYLEISDESDVNHLNGLVCVWANKCVYYHPGIMSGEHLLWTYKHVKDYRNPKHEEVEIPTGEKRSIIIARHPFPAFRMCLSFLKFQDKVKPGCNY
jgi:hypothetical protein